MVDDIPEARWFDDVVTLTFADLVATSGLSPDEVRELMEEGAFAPVAQTAPTFDARALAVAREASRVRREFALDDVHSVCVVLRFVERVQVLEQEIVALRARVGRE
jgi:hypothetical protein